MDKEFIDQLIENWKEFATMAVITNNCDSNSISDFYGWLVRKSKINEE